jgi:protein-S-isoprenylcysteine O-methyltransferase Ste14
MALREDYEKFGQWLFRYRSYVPLVLLPLYIVILYIRRNTLGDFINDYDWTFLCFMVGSIGMLIRIFAVGFSAPMTSGRNVKKQVANSINKTGIYSLIRHPLYLGNSFIWLGLAMRLKIWWLVLLVMTYYWFYYEKIMFTEEEFLRKKFGEEYEEWANRTPALMPDFKHWVKPEGKFSLKKIIRKENDGVYAFVMNLFFIELLADYFHDFAVHLSLAWIIIISVSTLLYVMIKIIKKKTRLLKELLLIVR